MMKKCSAVSENRRMELCGAEYLSSEMVTWEEGSLSARCSNPTTCNEKVGMKGCWNETLESIHKWKKQNLRAAIYTHITLDGVERELE